MAVRLRLQRYGAKHAPVYRVVAVDARFPRDGRFVEILGNYNPRASTPELQLTLKGARIDYWLGVGAKPSDTVRSLILWAKKEGCYMPELREESTEDLEAEEEGQETVSEVLDSARDVEEKVSEGIDVESETNTAFDELTVKEANDSEAPSSGEDEEVGSGGSTDPKEAVGATGELDNQLDENEDGEFDTPKAGAT